MERRLLWDIANGGRRAGLVPELAKDTVQVRSGRVSLQATIRRSWHGYVHRRSRKLSQTNSAPPSPLTVINLPTLSIHPHPLLHHPTSPFPSPPPLSYTTTESSLPTAHLPQTPLPDLILPIKNRKPHLPVPENAHIIADGPQRRLQHPPRRLMIIRVPRLQHQAALAAGAEQAAAGDDAVAFGHQVPVDGADGRLEEVFDARAGQGVRDGQHDVGAGVGGAPDAGAGADGVVEGRGDGGVGAGGEEGGVDGGDGEESAGVEVGGGEAGGGGGC